jgi:hypothetical protein
MIVGAEEVDGKDDPQRAEVYQTEVAGARGHPLAIQFWLGSERTAVISNQHINCCERASVLIELPAGRTHVSI